MLYNGCIISHTPVFGKNIFLSFRRNCAIIRIMKTIAVIAEFNPLHNGHAWFLAEARRRSQADAVVAVMSGDYVQRGEPAVFDKFIRAETALLAGADLVLELPAACASAGAGRFAEGAVRILDCLGCVDELWFGSESGSIIPFLTAAALLAKEPPAYAAALQDGLSRGMTFPAARSAALARTASSALAGLTDRTSLLTGPNNILGLEYCIALSRTGSRIRPDTLPRRGSGYHAPSLDTEMASATALRNLLLRCRPGSGVSAASSGKAKVLSDEAEAVLEKQMPPSCLAAVRRALTDTVPLCADDFSEMLHYQLLRETSGSLTAYLDLPADLADRMTRLLPQYRSWTQFASLVKARNFTRTQIDRAFLHVLLGIREQDFASAMRRPYARMLGFRTEASSLLTEIKNAGSLHLAAGAAELTGYHTDLSASVLYEARCSALTGKPYVHEFSRPVIRISS